jgi:dTDP-4-dehydrorhamnose reductase
VTTLLVTGANGQLGREFQALQPLFPEYRWVFTSRRELDLSDRGEVQRFFRENQVDYCLSCAAYTAVDLAESHPLEAAKVNVDAVRLLAEECRAQSAAFIHFSSDYVYHNDINRPLREEDPATPKGVYACTKWEGDLAALAAHPEALIFRISWVFSRFGNNFVKTMLRIGRERPELRVVCDQIGAPTHARDLALAVASIIRSGKAGGRGGIYHYSNEGVCSWYDFAKAIFDLSNLPVKVLPIMSKEYPTPASRPCYSVLDKTKFKETFGIEIPYWRDSLADCIRELG